MGTTLYAFIFSGKEFIGSSLGRKNLLLFLGSWPQWINKYQVLCSLPPCLLCIYPTILIWVPLKVELLRVGSGCMWFILELILKRWENKDRVRKGRKSSKSIIELIASRYPPRIWKTITFIQLAFLTVWWLPPGASPLQPFELQFFRMTLGQLLRAFLTLGAFHSSRAEIRYGAGRCNKCTIEKCLLILKKDLRWPANLHMLTYTLIYIQIS